MLTNQATARAANVDHVVATNNLEGARPQRFRDEQNGRVP